MFPERNVPFMMSLRGVSASFLFLSLSFFCFADTRSAPGKRINLQTGWRLQSSCKVKASGEAISSRSFQPKGWYKTSVPSTVLAAQVASGEFPDPYFGMNLRKIPGTTYPVAAQFAKLPMSPDSPYSCSWWYRTEFAAPGGTSTSLHFDGINYRANVWLNGKQLADKKNVAGAYRTYDFDVTSALVRTGNNVLAVEVFAPTENDLGINWVDWNPAPPDKDMGLWSDVYVTSGGPVVMRYPMVTTHLTDANAKVAELTIETELRNTTNKQIDGVLKATSKDPNIAIQQSVSLAPGESKTVRLTPQAFNQLRVENPKLWWPAQMGTPNLSTFNLRVLVGTTVSDEQRVRYGIREITSELDEKSHRVFRINGKRLLIRGGGWAPDMMLRRSSERLRAELAYVRDMNLNTIRLEGKMESDEFLNLADEMGILVMAGWCCCDIWEQWDKWNDDHLQIATASLRSQSMRLRSHPSLLVWLYGSDNPPPPNVERAYIDVLKQTNWPNPYISSATDTPTTVTGASGVKMTGPYDYVPPAYWYVDHDKHGGAYGFNTETSPGPAVPPVTSLRKMLGPEHMWPIDEFWNYHAGASEFKNMDIYNRGMDAVYGPASNVNEYATKSQAMAYAGERAMFEAYSHNKYTSTGVIQWMLNNAWPSTIWHLYDYYLQPAGGYYGTKKANEPVHISYSYDDRGVVAVNSRYVPINGLTATVHVYDFDLKEKFKHEQKLDLDADSTKAVVTLPEIAADAAGLYFLDLRLTDGSGKNVSSNFYWLSQKQPTFDWENTKFVSTPVTSDENMTALNRLPRVRLQVTAAQDGAKRNAVRVTLRNPSKNLAFQVHVGVLNANGDSEILPVLWDDNYFVLMPGEAKAVTARYLSQNPALQGAHVVVDGWNIEELKLPLSAPKAASKTLR
jgi:exo-1,4-beta-D-glucosaminidase